MDWVTREIITGMQRLTCLGLDREPASDLVEGTVMAWVEAVNLNRAWDEERDAPRFRRAFATLSATRKQWPSPADFLEAIPAHEPQQALPPPVCSPEQAKANLAKLQAILYGGSSE
jgi:hypothetical protein